MTEEEFLTKVGIKKKGIHTKDAYVIDLTDSDEYGKMFSILEESPKVSIMQENQVVTEHDSSLIYESEEYGYIINLIADFDSDRYQVIVNDVG